MIPSDASRFDTHGKWTRNRLYGQVTSPGQKTPRHPIYGSDSSLSALLNTQQLHFQHSNFGFGESRFKQFIAINSAPCNPLLVFIAALVL